VAFEFAYDPDLLDVTSVSLATGVPADWGVVADFTNPGQIAIAASGTTPLDAGVVRLVDIEAIIPVTAAYSEPAVLSLNAVQVNGGAIEATGDGSVETIAYLGDTTGNHRYSALDAAYIARVGVGLDGGFAAYRLKDPLLIGDVTANGRISALDAAYLARKAVGFIVPQIPDLPDGLPPIVPSGRDPLLSIPDDLTARRGEALTVPVSILDDATDLFEVELCVEYDTAVFDLDRSDVRAGDLTTGWTMVANVDDAAGTIVVHLFDTNPLSGGTGSVVEIDLHVRADAPYGSTTLDLTDDCMLNEGQLVVTLDDGLVTILADRAAPAAAVVNAAASPGVTTVTQDGIVPHTTTTTSTTSGAGLLGAMSIASDRPSSDMHSSKNSLLRARLGVTELMPHNTLGWQVINLQRPESASFGQPIFRPWSSVGNPGIRFTPGTSGRADAGIGWSGGLPTSFGASNMDDYIYSIYANYL